MEPTVTTRPDTFSVEAQADDLRAHTWQPRDVWSQTTGAIAAFAKQGGAFDEFSPEERLQLIRNALAAAELVHAEMTAR